MNEVTGSPAKCVALFESAGFQNVVVEVQPDHDYLEVDWVVGLFDLGIKAPMSSKLREITPESLR